MKTILIGHFRCPLHRYTFSVKTIRTWVEQTCEGRVLNLFAGQTRLAVDEVRNDLDPQMPADFHLDALEFLRGWTGEKFRTILLDPPYAYRKSMELYKGMVCSPFRQLKDAIPACLEPGGLVITFGYHSIVMGRNRVFRLERLAIFSHGGAIHDTIASVERYEPADTVILPLDTS
jgi:23S rRNA G2069 N7-methylase RlmK/C1962 C5-methylase RlmI